MKQDVEHAHNALTRSPVIRLYSWPPTHVWDQKYFAPSHISWINVSLIGRDLRRGKGGQRRVSMRLNKSPRIRSVKNTVGDEAS